MLGNNFKAWLKDVLIRTVKTMAQTAIGVISSTALITEVNWGVVLSAVALSGVSCILMNIANMPEEEIE